MDYTSRFKQAIKLSQESTESSQKLTGGLQELIKVIKKELIDAEIDEIQFTIYGKTIYIFIEESEEKPEEYEEGED